LSTHFGQWTQSMQKGRWVLVLAAVWVPWVLALLHVD
jgi:hypothetical protein